MTDVDKAKLLEHLATWSKHPNILIHAVSEGLRQQVVRGDLDAEEER